MFDQILHQLQENPYAAFLAGVVGLGIAAQWLAWRVRLPSILLLLAFGFAAGQLGIVDTDRLVGRELLFSITSLSVAIILFEGGMTLRFRELDESGKTVLRLVTLGALVTWLLTAVSAWLIFDFRPSVAALSGAILVVTGPTVIGPLLRHIRPTRRIESILKWEGIVIDPIGAVLAVLVFEFVAAGGFREAAAPLAMSLLVTVVTGGMIGAMGSFALVALLKRFWIPDFLHNPLILAVVLVSFAVSNLIQDESGLLTVTVLGVMLANQTRVPVRHVAEFKENLQVLLISCLFILLSSRIKLDDLAQVAVPGALLLAVLVLVVRPAAVFLSTIGAGLELRERWFVSLVAPRGIVAAAVSSVFALKIVELNETAPLGTSLGTSLGEIAADAQLLAPLTFLIIIGTVAVYGLAAAPLARRLGLADANPQGLLLAGAADWVRHLAQAVHDEGFDVMLIDTNYANIADARMNGLRTHCASVLSEYVREEIELGGMGRFLALTPNNEVNTLAAGGFTHFFGRAGVYQMAPEEAGASRNEAALEHLRGRLLFGSEITHRYLAYRFAAGARVKVTRLTDEFTFADFQARYGESAIVLFVKTASDELRIPTVNVPLEPQSGQSVIALVHVVPEDQPAAASCL